MRHAVLGTGGVGGLIGGALARIGADVVLVMRPETLARYPGRLEVRSRVPVRRGRWIVDERFDHHELRGKARRVIGDDGRRGPVRRRSGTRGRSGSR